MPGDGGRCHDAGVGPGRASAGDLLPGPAIVHQMDSTTVVLAGQRVTVTDTGDLILTEEQS